MGRFGGWGDFPTQGGKRGGISENRQNSSSSNVPENIHTKFEDNRTKFREFGILGGEVPPWGANGGILEN